MRGPRTLSQMLPILIKQHDPADDAAHVCSARRKAGWLHGHYSAQAKRERREARVAVQLLRKLLD
jgi:hypothetical protein